MAGNRIWNRHLFDNWGWAYTPLGDMGDIQLLKKKKKKKKEVGKEIEGGLQALCFYSNG